MIFDENISWTGPGMGWAKSGVILSPKNFAPHKFSIQLKLKGQFKLELSYL